MFYLEKKKDKDFVILNLTDPQIADDNVWGNDRIYNIMMNTTKELVERINPDLITVTGDISYGSMFDPYDYFADFIAQFNIPWAVVWGNHDNQGGQDNTDRMERQLSKRKNFIYEKGEPALGNGNYVIVIREEGKPVEALIMMDTHDSMPYKDGNAWAKLLPNQIEWYREQVKALKETGCNDSTLFMHIPIYAYRTALDAAVKDKEAYYKLRLDEIASSGIWNEGYESSYGVNHEKSICSYPEDEGMFDAILECDHTKNVISGHDHINNTVINYKGVKLVYALKTGPGCYWEKELNGGTVITVGKNGVKELHHEYVDPTEWLK